MLRDYGTETETLETKIIINYDYSIYDVMCHNYP